MSGNRSVAREMFKEPNLLILDEATSALDTEMGRRVARTLGRSATSRTASMRSEGEVTVVLIAHRLPGRSRTWICVYVPRARGVWPRRARTTRCARAGSRGFARRPEMQRL